MSVTSTPTGSCRYIFNDESSLEKERLKRLNELYNENTISLLKPCLQRPVRVLEIGPGTGEIGSWIAKQVGQINYTALDTSAENIDTLRAMLPEAACISGSVTDVDKLDELKGKKFDVIFIRWVLAYIPKEQVEFTLKLLFDKLLNENGTLLCEECNVYKVHCITNDDARKRLDVKCYGEWLQLTRDVQSLEGVHADFEIGHGLKRHFASLNAEISVHTFQPILDSQYQKEIPVLAMKAAKTFLLGKKVRNEDELDQLTSRLAEVAIDPSLSVKYLKNRAIIAKKGEAHDEGNAYREFLNDKDLQQEGALGL
ncbi:MAG: class I SAM-dependent methyltransferase [Verrucomicrobia bacterium]|nr:class I SAM-dependent methyltransferase [Verrucomicrobiota bacterium]MBS0638016.1 class I SAM-dependent methyltransferase [Verrucomicrobiota bacterium]